MSDTMRRLLAWFPMFGVVALALRAVSVWNSLPPIVASHFAANGLANGWMPRDQFFVMSFVVTVPMVVLLAVIADRAGRDKPVTGLVLLFFDWLVSALLIVVFWGAIDANLYHRPLSIVPVWIIVAALIPVALGIGIDWAWWLSKDRKAADSESTGHVQVIAEERHSSSRSALAMLVLAAGFVALFLSKPLHNSPGFLFVVLALALALIVGAAGWAWYGFVYRFTTAAVDITTFGIRLRRIPLIQIKSFDAQTVHPLTDFGGWGIKGFGTDTAYIWGGNKALHIKTYTGDVYLGHAAPERLVHDLERVIKPVQQ